MENDRVETDAVEEAKVDGELFNLVEDGASNFDDGEFCGVGGIGRRGEDAEVAFDFTLSTDRIEKAGDGVLEKTWR